MEIALLFIFFLVLFFAVLPEILPKLSQKIVQLVVHEKDEQVRLEKEVNQLQQELHDISMVDQFAKYAKVERRINKAKEELNRYNKSKSDVLLKVRLGTNVLFHVVQAICFIGIIYKYRAVPMIQLPEEWFFPISSLVAFPSGVPGAIGVTCWLLVCRNVIRKGLSMLKT